MLLLCENCFLEKRSKSHNTKFRPAKPLYAIRKSNMFDSHYTIHMYAPIRAYTSFSNSVLLCDPV